MANSNQRESAKPNIVGQQGLPKHHLFNKIAPRKISKNFSKQNLKNIDFITHFKTVDGAQRANIKPIFQKISGGKYKKKKFQTPDNKEKIFQ